MVMKNVKKIYRRRTNHFTLYICMPSFTRNFYYWSDFITKIKIKYSIQPPVNYVCMYGHLNNKGFDAGQIDEVF